MTHEIVETCYRHPARAAVELCPSCDRPVCEECIDRSQSVIRCPSCAWERANPEVLAEKKIYPVVTITLIAINIALFIVELAFGGFESNDGGRVIREWSLYGPPIHNQDEYWRLVTGGFLHGGLEHIALNMAGLYVMGSVLERAIGRSNFICVYFAVLLTGSFGALLASPDERIVGASGAIFGLLAMVFLVTRNRSGDPMRGAFAIIVAVTVFNNIISAFSDPQISVGGHAGGFVGGLILGWLLVRCDRDSDYSFVPIAASVVVSVLAVVGSLAVVN